MAKVFLRQRAVEDLSDIWEYSTREWTRETDWPKRISKEHSKWRNIRSRTQNNCFKLLSGPKKGQSVLWSEPAVKGLKMAPPVLEIQILGLADKMPPQEISIKTYSYISRFNVSLRNKKLLIFSLPFFIQSSNYEN